MSRKSESIAWLLPVALVGAAAAGLVAVVGTSRPSTEPPADKQPPPAALPNILWFGGASRENIDGLAFLFASENEHGSLLLWALQALAANTFAKLLGRAHPQVKSIADMLRSGIHKPTRKRLYGLAWGPQYDKGARITRWAATTAGQHPGRVA